MEMPMKIFTIGAREQLVSEETHQEDISNSKTLEVVSMVGQVL